MDYEKKGEDELQLKRDESLRVLWVFKNGVILCAWYLNTLTYDILYISKRYAHWSYAIKETGERGWVPSWFIGKLASNREKDKDKSAETERSREKEREKENGTEKM